MDFCTKKNEAEFHSCGNKLNGGSKPARLWPRVRYGTYALSHSGPIQAGAEKLGICGSLRGRLGAFGRGTPVRLLVRDLLVSGGETRGRDPGTDMLERRR